MAGTRGGAKSWYPEVDAVLVLEAASTQRLIASPAGSDRSRVQ